MTRRRLTIAWILSIASFFQFVAQAQQSPITSMSAALPHLLRFNGTAKDPSGHSLTGTVGITFSLYSDQDGDSPLWLETQNVQLDHSGHYSVLLGSTKSEGLPVALFAAEQAHWVGVEITGQAEVPRVLLVSAPYALKAGDAETVGGLPPSAFMLAAPLAAGADSIPSALDGSSNSGTNVGGKGSVGYLAGWIDNNGDLGNSVLYQAGSGSNAKIGLNVKNPLATLDISGTELVRGLFESATTGAATGSKGFNSNPVDLEASSFNDSTQKAVMQHFEWQAEPTGNNTNNPGATLNLLFGQNSNAPTETGLKLSNTGIFSFAAGQTFPGTGNGTITGVTAGTDLTGGGNSGSVTLNLDTTKVPQLGSNNFFTSTQQFAGNTGIGTAPSGTSYTPLSVGSSNGFGTWFSIANTSSGGHTWNILSAGGANAEGAGNLGITDLTGKSTIWLEGNTKTSSLTATGSAGGAIVEADAQGANNDTPTPGLRFGGGSSGETIASNRNIGLNRFGLDVYTSFTPRVAITQSGQMGIATQVPHNQLDVVGQSNQYDAIYASGARAADGSNQNGGEGVEGFGGDGDLTSTTTSGASGVVGWAGNGTGSYGAGGFFIAGTSVLDNSTGPGVVGLPSPGATSDPLGWGAAFFQGNVTVAGNLAKLGGSFKIDHPLDPANKFLSHSFVESPDMKNIYDGVTTLDTNGEAMVQMPEWFTALNRDFRYQLTCIGGFAPIYIAEEVAENHFKIGGGRPGMKVSWQVTGIRHDAWADAHRIPVEQEKPEQQRGYYLAPELFGASPEKAMIWAAQPSMMKRVNEIQKKRTASTSAVQSTSTPSIR